MSTPTHRQVKTGRTQEERSEAMRLRLLDATIDCLVEYGYAGTTTTRVAERAGVTRGAQTHHFPTKADLVTAAVRHLAAQRVAQAMQQLERGSEADDRIDAALELVWQLHQGPIFQATAELWGAARVDAELQAHMNQVEPTVKAAVTELGRAAFGSYGGTPEFKHCLYTVMDAVRGILQAGFGSQAGGEELEARWQRAKACLRVMVEVMCGEPPAGPEG